MTRSTTHSTAVAETLRSLLLDSGLPGDEAKPPFLRRVRAVNMVALVVLGLAGFFATTSALAGPTTAVAFYAGLALLALASMLWLRRRRDPALAGHLLVASVAAAVAVCRAAGTPPEPWLHLLPVIAALLLGPWAAWAWIGAALALLLATSTTWPTPASLVALGLVASAGAAFQRRTERGLEAEVDVRRHAEQRARASNLAKDEFLANVSHEIRTPMNAVVGMVDLLLRDAPSAEQRRRLEVIDASAEALLTLVDDILDLSKIEAGKLAVDPRDFALRPLLRQVVHLLEPRAEHLELRSTVDDELPEMLLGDPARLRQVLMNLLGNAIKFTREGHVELRAERRFVGDLPRLAVSVHDTGIGISPRDQQRLFEPFAQADTSSAREVGGTGLGLAICKRLVELMGGEIGVDSRRGEGSVFRFWIPLVPAAGGAPRTPERATASADFDPARGDSRVLVVDDNPVNRLVAESQLEALGYRVDTADSGDAALERLERERYAAVLMDCQMPGMDGFETTRRLRRRESRRHPVIAVTAHAMQGERERCLAAGMDDYLSKPYRGEELAAVLERWLPVPMSAAGPEDAAEDAP